MQNGDDEPVPDNVNHNGHYITISETPPINSSQYTEATSTENGFEVAEIEEDRNGSGFSLYPSKKRKLTDADSRPRSTSRLSRPLSPPWKKFGAEGPTSFVEDGRRKSSRTNVLPVELQLQGDKRKTRASIAHGESPSRRNARETRTSCAPSARSKQSGKLLQTASFVKPNGVPASVLAPAHRNWSGNQQSRRSDPADSSSVMKRRGRRSLVPEDTHNVVNSATIRSRPDRRTRHSHSDVSGVLSDSKTYLSISELRGYESPSPTHHKTQRLRLTVRAPVLPVLAPGHRTRHQRYRSFHDFMIEDGLCFDEKDSMQHRFTEGEALKEFHLRSRILSEGGFGGLLSQQKCILYQPDEQDEPEPVYGHAQHLSAHAIFLRELVRRERSRHMAAAKRLAQACAEEWRKRQPKTDEDMDKEERAHSEARFKQVARDISMLFENVKAAVNVRKLERFRAEQDARDKQALNMMVEHSARLVHRRNARATSTGDLTEREEDESSEDAEQSQRGSDLEDADSANMSTSEIESDPDVADNDEDANLTLEQIREKYAAALRDENTMTASGADASDIEDHVPAQSLAPISHARWDTVDKSSEREKYSVEPIGTGDGGTDDARLADTDESVDMDSDDYSDTASFTDEEGFSGSEGSGDLQTSLYGMFSTSERARLLKQSKVSIDDIPRNDCNTSEQPELTGTNMKTNESDEDLADQSLQSPLRGQDQRALEEQAAEVKDALVEPLNTRFLQVTPDADALSGDPSSRLSPNVSTNAKPSEVDSASSVGSDGGSKEASPSVLEQLASVPVAKTEIPHLLRGTLREYQHDGLDWLAGLYKNHHNGILADEMGLGKTIQTIALLAHLAVEHRVWGPHLVVVPTSVMLNWEMEFKKWCPGFKILTYYGTQDERKQKRKGWLDDDKYHVCITSYQLVLSDAQAFKRRNWHYLILDEAHNIKNFKSQRWQTMLTFKTRARLLLTGTPLQNSLVELWSLLTFLEPVDVEEGGFGELADFMNQFKKPVKRIIDEGKTTLDDESRAIVKNMHIVLRPFLLRRLKKDVEKQMPNKYEHVVTCRLSKRQRQLYDGFLAQSDTRQILASGNYLSIVNCLMSLRKVCNHPDLFETRQIVTSFAMHTSVVADFEVKDLLVRKRLLERESERVIDLDFFGFKLARNEQTSMTNWLRGKSLRATRQLQDLLAKQAYAIDHHPINTFDGSTVEGVLSHVQRACMRSRLDELRNCIFLTFLRSEKRPVYGSALIEKLTFKLDDRLTWRQQASPRLLSQRYLSTSSKIAEMIPTLGERAESVKTTIAKFSCVTPAVVTSDLTLLALTRRGASLLQSVSRSPDADPFHEARVRLSIAFPDKRLLQYDCGKLQRLDKLLRELSAGGHRALIFTQMTKVLDILEQFLNIHGHRYLRLDGATKLEQRQVLTDRFNNDKRILAFILSSRSGGLGINLTGADTVIFYDLDWNPAMDKQCQDRAHRIGQTRDVNIYRLVSEGTIEANILRKSNQKRLLDDVMIQEGDFTTDYFNRVNYRDMLDDPALTTVEAELGAAMDKAFGDGPNSEAQEAMLESAEDKEDREAAKQARTEIPLDLDVKDFEEASASHTHTPRTSLPPTPSEIKTAHSACGLTDTGAHTADMRSGLHTVATGAGNSQFGLLAEPQVLYNNLGEQVKHIDEYMFQLMERELQNVPIRFPASKDRKRGKKDATGRIRYPRKR